MPERLALTELARQLLQHAEPELLDARLDVLGERFQDQEVASLLRAAFEAGEADCLRNLLREDQLPEWVDRTLTASEEARLETELSRLLGVGAAGADDPERLVQIGALPADYRGMLAWAEEHDVLEELRRPVRDVLPEVEVRDPDLTVVEAALGEYERTAAPKSLHGKPDPQALSAAHLRRLAAARGALGARTTLWKRNPVGPLRLLGERLRALVLKTSLGELHRERFVPAHPVQVDLRTGVVSARLRGDGAKHTLAVRLFLSGFEQRQIEGECSACAGARCVHVVTVAARLLDACLNEQDRLHRPLRELVEVPSWKRVLHELAEQEPARSKRPERVGFLLRVSPRGVQVGSVLQRDPPDARNPAGRLCTPQQLLRHGACSDLDRPVLEALAPHARALSPSYVQADLAVLRALAEHPAVKLEASGSARDSGRTAGPTPVRVSEGILNVELLEQAGGLLPKVSLHGVEIVAASAPEHNQSYVLCEPPAQNALVFAPLTHPLRKLLAALSHFRGVFPEESFPTLAPWLSSLRGAAHVSTPKVLDGHERPSPRQLLLRFTPGADEGLDLALTFRPLPLGGFYPPGRGPTLVHGLEGGKAVHARRDLAWETHEATRVLNALELVGQIRIDAFSYRIESTQEALEVLSRAAKLGSSVAIEWAENVTPLTISNTAQLGNLKVELFKKGQWFSLQGGLTQGETLVAVSTLLETARRGERFVRIDGENYVELEQALFERLQSAQLCMLELSPGDLKLPSTALPFWLQKLGDNSVAGDEASRAWLSRIREPQNEVRPDLADIGVTLRPYQQAGVAWILSQAQWAHGVCLADEMGLGKTLQAGTVLALRRALGPAMVVAPTSLLDNWRNELTRCSSRLKPLVYRGEQRAALLAGLGAGDVVLVSYETLLRDQDEFESIHFATQVIDEAQVVKNARTQRALAVASIQADFRIALSGTPIENRLGDLWSLLELIAPGLLGNWQRFRARFATPIERYEDMERAAQLKALVTPFFLRRTKREVEAELPLRTEVLCSVELSPPERDLYEAAVHEARRALGHRNRHDARRTVKILAELTRLRQLACHPRLVVEAGGSAREQNLSTDVSSSKLERLLGLLDDILPRGHRALVFSQFTRHLALVREALEQRGTPYLYLDGSTPGGARNALVERFQRGDMPLFLISLKAGGTGLNLTEADYVIHLDPWWNPAAEDQASDRAHRLGQQRPVTVVKLVTQDTIEEKVLALHAHKRRLADAVLLGEGAVAELDQETLESLLLD